MHSKKNIKILDCTLRDGGFTNDFYWSNSFLTDYFKTVNSLPLEYVEVGYWKQKNKSRNQFYNINEKDLFSFKKKCKIKLAVITDFHYSTKNEKDFPKKKDGLLSLIRVTSRIEDLDDTVDFINRLKDYTKLNISLNIFNFSSNTEKNLEKISRKLKKCNADFFYFADTHGNLDFNYLPNHFAKFIDKINSFNKKIGFHFHDNIGTAYSNYIYCINNGFQYFDSTIFGIGRGGGNLRTEFLVDDKFKSKLVVFINKYKKSLEIPYNLYCLITGINSVSNIYANYAYKNRINLSAFNKFCLNLNNKDKNNFNSKKIEKIL
tara:strand:+ start:1095 stop:2051 length:957 start_codon:yes stop_codon:yes gene_type:complete